MSALALRFAWRELRGGLRGFGVFVACIVLGVMAIAGVGSVAKSLSDGLSSAGRVILGGDLAFSLVQREASGEEQAFLGAHGVVSVAATLPTMARTDDGRAALVEIKAVDGAYPLFGAVVTNPAMPLPALFARQGDAFGAAVDPALLSRLDLKPGDRIAIGNAAIELRAVLTGEPDKLAGGIGFGPRVLISEAALRASGLLQPGSIVRWQYRLRLPDGPFELLDVVGLDVSLAIEQELYMEFREPGFAPAPLLEHLVTAGYLGRKTGRGFRDYAEPLTVAPTTPRAPGRDPRVVTPVARVSGWSRPPTATGWSAR